MAFDAVQFLELLYRADPVVAPAVVPAVVPAAVPAVVPAAAPAVVPAAVPAADTTRPELTPDDLSHEWRAEYEERAAIREYDGDTPRELAEHYALLDVAKTMKAGDTPVQALPAPVVTAWDTPLAITMMAAADASVERYGSHGRDSRIQDLAEQVVDAHGRRDMATLKAACFQIAERSKEMATHTTN